MSIKQEVENLEREREKLKRDLEEMDSELAGLKTRREPIEKKVASLKSHTSSLAQTLLEQELSELNNLNQQIETVQRRKNEIKKSLELTKKRISERLDDTGLYIQEQSNLLVSTFLAYLGNHLEEVGRCIEKNYSIRGLKSYNFPRVYAPNGNVGIYDEDIDEFICSTNDFFFRKELYTVEEDIWLERRDCIWTPWYRKYRKRFDSVLLETLQKQFSYRDFFKLTIKETGFTLELV